MQISCPQCASSYELDERVLPPGGAPVQCTRCSHVFTAQPPPTPDRGGTQTFGVSDTEPPTPASDGTRLYGRTSSGPHPAIPTGTVAYGRTEAAGIPSVPPVQASPGGEPPPARTTQTFGVTPQARTTQVFGAASAPEAPGAPGTPGEPARSTQMFGAVAAGATAADGATEPARSTQMFGAVPAPPADGGRTTRMFGAVPTDPVPAAGGPTPGETARSTRMFGAVSADPATGAPAGQGEVARSTQMFGAVPAEPPRSTQLFGAPSATPPRNTQLFGTGQAVPDRPTRQLGTAQVQEALGASRAAHTPAAGDPVAPLIAARRRRRNVVLGAMALVALAVAGLAGWQWWKRRPVEIPAEAQAIHSTALTALRRDDTASLQQAVEALEPVIARWPAYTEARATLLIALLFQLDDARMEIERINQRSTGIHAEINRLKERKAPSDWENRVNALIAELETLKAQSDPLIERATELDAKVGAAFRAITRYAGKQPPDHELQVTRAQAVYFGVKGTDQAISLAERYRLLGGGGGWADIAFAEYALNTRVAPATRAQAREALEDVKGADASFIRVYVLLGRLWLADKDTEAASSAFDAAATLNPKHDVARGLFQHLEAQKAAALAAP